MTVWSAPCANTHRINASASLKKSTPPKFPDFSASTMSPFGHPAVRSTGTPAAISSPIRNAGIFS